MKRFILILFLIIAAFVSAENGPSPIITPGSVSGLGTIATVNSPIPIANGGTGSITAAGALTNLGGASLNGSSTVDFNTKNLEASGFSTFGNLGTGLKTMIATGTTAAAEGGTTVLSSSPITAANFASYDVQVFYSPGAAVKENNPGAGYKFSTSTTGEQITFTLHATESESILSAPIVALIWYKE